MIAPHDRPRPPKELQVLEQLNARMKLTADDQVYYHNLEKGYLGELKFAKLLDEQLTASPILLYDLLFEANHTEFQIDCLPIFNHKIYQFEIKYLEGDFYYYQNGWYLRNSNKEIRSPLEQLNRSHVLLRQKLQKLGYSIEINPYVIFVNPEFTLYQAPLNSQIVFPTQIKRFINMLNNQTTNMNHFDTKLAKQLTDMHLTESAHSHLPAYNYKKLKKGIICQHCSAFLSHATNQTLNCNVCGRTEDMCSAIIRSVYQFKILFPDEKIKTNHIYDWCGGVASVRSIRRALQQNFKTIGQRKGTYYMLDGSNVHQNGD